MASGEVEEIEAMRRPGRLVARRVKYLKEKLE